MVWLKMTCLLFLEYTAKENELKRLINLFMPDIVEEDGYTFSLDGCIYNNVDDENYSFETEVSPSAIDLEKDNSTTCFERYNFEDAFRDAILSELDKIKTSLVKKLNESLGKELDFFKLIYQECCSFINVVDISLLHKKFPFFKEAIISLIDFIESQYPLYCPERIKYPGLITKQKNKLTAKIEDFENLDERIKSYYQSDPKRYSIEIGSLSNLLHQLSTNSVKLDKFDVTIKPSKNFYYLLSQLHVKISPVNYELLSNSLFVRINNSSFSIEYKESYPSQAQPAFKKEISNWLSTL